VSPASIGEVLSERARETPSRLAFRFLLDGEGEEAVLTVGELDRRARAVAAGLRAAGAVDGDRVLLLHSPSLEYVVGFFGCLYAGLVAVPAYPPSSRSMARLQSIAEDARPRFALTSPALHARIERHFGQRPELAGLTWIAQEPAAGGGDLCVASEPGALAVLQYTSGSTRAPRGVMLTHRHLVLNAELLTERGGFTPEDREVSWLPPFHDMGLIGAIVAPVLVGCESTLFAPAAFLQRPARWLRAVSRHRATLTGGPNFAFDLCVRRVSSADLESLDLRSLRFVFTGAERVRPETLERFSAAFARTGFRKSTFAPCYGLAEATLGVSLGPLGGPSAADFDEAALGAGRVEEGGRAARPRRLVASGAPLAGCEVIAVDPATRVRCEPDRVGELWVRGPTVASGYWNKPELTEQTFRARLAGREGAGDPEYLRTGDLGFLRGGQLFVAGRLKDLLILLGANHYPEDLEATAQGAHPALQGACGAAFSVEVDGEERLVIVHEVERQRDRPTEEILAALRSAIAEGHELSVHEVVLLRPGGIPRTSSGKIQRSLCRAQYLAGELEVLASGRGAVPAGPPPPAALVEQVSVLAAGVLGVGRVEPEDDFFALGGHSLLATQLVSRLNEALAVDLPLRAVFEARTPLALAARVAQSAARARLPPIAPIDRRDPLPLSFSQERMWFLHQLDPAGSAYNVAGALEIEGPLDPDALEAALRGVVESHEILRARFPAVEGAPAVEISPSLEIPLPRVDLSGCDDPGARAQELASELAAAPFDLARDALFRARLFGLGPDRHVLAVSLHHMVIDGWSMGVLLAEVLDGYQARVSGRAALPPAQSLQYVDYAAWQRAHLSGSALDEQLAWWARQLDGAPRLELPSDRRPAAPSARGDHEPFDLPADLLAAMDEVGRVEGATRFMVLLAAFEVLLHRYTGETDIVLGTPVANRNRLPAERFIGTLVNTLPIRVRLDPGGRFCDLLRTVREACLDAYAHQDAPFERVVASLKLERRKGQSPLFSVMFDYQNAPIPVRDASGLRLRPLSFSRRGSQFDLSLMVLDAQIGRLASVEYRTDLFEADTIRNLIGHYRSVLEAVAADAQAPISRIPLLRPEERAAMLERAGAACRGSPPGERVIARFEAQAARTPGAPAVIDELGAVTYRQLDRLSEELAARLRERGAGPGARIAVCLERSRALVVALLAALKARAAYVPLDPRYPSERLSYVLEDAAPAAVVTEAPLRPRLPAGPQVAILELDPRALPEPRAGATPASAAPEEESRPDLAAYVIYTSGSTGRPKGVEIPDRALSNFLTSMQHTPGLSPADRVLSVTTVSFDIAGLELLLPLVTGACVELVPAEAAADGARLRGRLERGGVSLMQATPATWRLLIEAGWKGDGALKILVGGEALPRELADQLLARGGSVWNMYGPTETTIWSSVQRVGPGAEPVAIGFPVDHTRLYVLDGHGELVPRGVPGEIFIGGAGVANGYFRRPELTAERFLPDPFAGPGARMYRTGDAGRFRSDGSLEYLGRLDHQLKIRGYRIEPGEIEAVLEEHPAVARAVVVGREIRPGDVRLTAYYQTAPGPRSEPRDLRDHCRRKLPEFMVPSFLVPVEDFPLTPNGKLDRRALPAPSEADDPAGAAPVAPRDELEDELARIWSEVLGVEVRSIRDSFFDLGGHSLLAARLMAQVEKHTGVPLPLAALLDAPTVEQLAEAIRSHRRRASRLPEEAVFAHLLAIERSGSRTPLFCVHGAGGHALNLHDLARRMGAGRPFYAFQARGVDGISEPHATIPEMASAYLAELRAVQARGPYFLAGYCAGGLVAYEMAQQLLEAGESVAFLGLIDLYRPGIPLGPTGPRHWARILVERPPREIWRRARAKIQRDLRRLAQTIALARCRAWRRTIPHALRDEWLTRAFLRASARYALRPFPGKLHLFRARESGELFAGVQDDLGWAGYGAGGLMVRHIPGDHYSLMREPNVQLLAAELAEALRASEPNPLFPSAKSGVERS
jgi:amino acid adenylation domain-containing protein